MISMRSKIVIPTALAALALAAVVVAQTAKKPATPPAAPAPAVNPADKTLHFQSSVGSFKILPPSEDPVTGTLTFNFTGTVLISDLQGTATPTGNVRKEYDNAEHHKTLYFGTGKMTVAGKFRSVQFFGRDVDGEFTGVGIMRLYGEFDRNLKTGYFWFDPKDKKPWGNGGMQVPIPQVHYNQPGNGGQEPTVKDASKG